MYLVTGGSGFCGFEIVKFLLSKGERVRVLDIEPMPENIAGVEFVNADIRDGQNVSDACRGIDRVIHTVAKVPISKAGREFHEVNAGGTRHILEAALSHKIKKVVHLSSSAVQMSEHNPVPEEAPYNPVGLYARTKMEAEIICKEYIARGLSVDMIRPRTVIGSGRLGIFDILFDWIADGKNIYVIGSGRNKIQFLHSKDLAECCYLASQKAEAGVYNVGSKNFSTLREDLGALINFAGTGSKIVSLPVAPSILLLQILDVVRLSPLASWHYLTYHKDFYFNNEAAFKGLGWAPKYGNRDILMESYKSYRDKKEAVAHFGTSHRKALKQGLLKILKRVS